MIDLITYESLIQKEYIEFFSNKNSEYIYEDGEGLPHYIGIAFEFMCKISSADLKVDYTDLYDNVFKDEKWLYVDSLEGLSDQFIASLTATQVVTILVAIRHKELFCTGFFMLCGQTGTISRLLKQLESKLKRKEYI